MEDERPSEQVMRELAEERERQEAERQRQADEKAAWRAKAHALSEAKSGLDRMMRVIRWQTDSYSRPYDYTEEKFSEELEIAAWQIQGAGEVLRSLMPELFWPHGTPVSIAGAVFFKQERLQAFRLDLEALMQSVDDVLLDTVDPSEVEVEEEDDDA